MKTILILGKKSVSLLALILSTLVGQTAVFADEIIHYDNQGRAVNEYQCDEVNAHQSSRQDTLVCTRKARSVLNDLNLQVIRDANDTQRCQSSRNCVVIDNPLDPNWPPVALTGIPDAVFGRNANGRSCVVIRESKPSDGAWASSSWRLCTNSPNVELAYTYALGYATENIDPSFKTKKSRRVCFADALKGYKFRKFWTDNCLFIRPIGKPNAGLRKQRRG